MKGGGFIRFSAENRAALLALAGREPLTRFVLRTLSAALGIVLEPARVGRPPKRKPAPPKPAAPKPPKEKRERTDDARRRLLLPGMPEESRALPWREYVRLRRHYRHLGEVAAKHGLTVGELVTRRAEGRPDGEEAREYAFRRPDAARIAQARSAVARHAALIERFNAVVPEAFRAQYAGHEAQALKTWRRMAREEGTTFQAVVARVMARKVRAAAKRDAAAERAEARARAKAAQEAVPWEERMREGGRRGAEIRHAAMLARFAELVPEERRARYAGRERAALRSWRQCARIRGLTVEEYVARLWRADDERAKAAKPPKAPKPPLPAPPPKNDAGHPWHAAIRPQPPAGATEQGRAPTREALAKRPAPERTAAASRYRNCARCRHAGLFRCLVWPALAVDERHICQHFDCERDAGAACFSEP